MLEQVVEINFRDIGSITITPVNYSVNESNTISIDNIKFYNVPKLKVNQTIPLQYNEDPSKESANIILQEETKYLIIFKAKHSIDVVKFPTLELYKNDFKLTKSIIDNKTFIINFNTGSYVGKSFFDVIVNNLRSDKIAFEVRPRKMGLDDYSVMLSDLCETASGIVFDSAPVFEHQKLTENIRKTFYEDYIFLEYLFRPENLITAYEHIRRDPHRILIEYKEPVPITLTSNAGPTELINMVSDSGNMYRIKNKPKSWPKNLKDFVPNEIKQSHYKETVNNPENRFVKYFIQVLDDLIEELIRYIYNKEIEGYAADKIYKFKSISNEYLRDKWLDDVGEMEYFPSNSQVLQKKYGYRDILRFFNVLESAFYIDFKELEELIKGHQRKLFDLYEYWCYIKLFNILSTLEGNLPEYNKLFDKDDYKEWSASFKKGVRSKQLFKVNLKGEIFEIELYYNRSFQRNKSPYRSYSLTLRPDYTIVIKNKSKMKMIHFDAKYRLNIFFEEYEINKRDIEEAKRIYKSADVYKMHTYKDAIKNSLGAYVLYPGNEKERIFMEESPHKFPSVGAFPLTPGGDAFKEESKIGEFIEDVLEYLSMN